MSARTLVTTTEPEPVPTAVAPSPSRPWRPPDPSRRPLPSRPTTTISGRDAAGLVAAVVALAGGLLLWRRRRSGAAFSGAVGDLARRVLVALDAVAAQGSVVAGQIEALAAEAAELEAAAPDDASRAHVADVRTRLDEFAAALESDRGLRLSTPPAGEEQLAYSAALIREQAEQLRSLLRPHRGERAHGVAARPVARGRLGPCRARHPPARRRQALRRDHGRRRPRPRRARGHVRRPARPERRGQVDDDAAADGPGDRRRGRARGARVHSCRRSRSRRAPSAASCRSSTTSTPR